MGDFLGQTVILPKKGGRVPHRRTASRTSLRLAIQDLQRLDQTALDLELDRLMSIAGRSDPLMFTLV